MPNLHHKFLVLLLFALNLNAQTDTLIAQKLLDKAWEFRNINTDSLLVYANQSIAASSNWSSGLSQGYTRKAIAFKQTGKPDSAAYYYLKAIKIRREIGPKVKLITCYNNYAIFLKDFGNYNKSIEYSLLAYQLACELDTSLLIADIAMTTGSTYRRLNEYITAQKYYNIADSIYNTYGSPIDKALIGVNIANLLTKTNRPDDALYRIANSISAFTEQNNINGLAIAYNAKGEAYFLKNFNDSAQTAFYKALNLYNQIHNINGITTSKINIASVHIKSNDLNKAKTLLYEITSLAKQNHDVDGLKDIASLFIDYFILTNKSDSISKYLALKDSINNQIINNIKLIEIAENTIKFEILDKNILINSQKTKLITKEKNIYLISILCLCLIISIIFIVTIYKYKLRISHKQSQLQSKQIKTLLSDQELKSINAMLEVQETERKRIAEDLHDRVGSILSTIKLYFSSLNNKMDSYQQENKEQYDKASSLLDEAVQEVRHISHNLVSGILMKFGLVPALRDLCETIEGTKQLKTSLNIHGLDDRIDNTIEIAIYRIIQELVSNTMKHAKANVITISITRLNNHINIMVEDDGKGFDTQAVSAGIGLKNIRSRIEKLSGKINFDSVIDRGTIVIVEIPV